jgi:hypothetical protein
LGRDSRELRPSNQYILVRVRLRLFATLDKAKPYKENIRGLNLATVMCITITELISFHLHKSQLSEECLCLSSMWYKTHVFNVIMRLVSPHCNFLLHPTLDTVNLCKYFRFKKVLHAAATKESKNRESPSGP